MHNVTVTLREALSTAASRLGERDDLRASAYRDAELLLLHTLNAPRTLLFTSPEQPLTAAELAGYEGLIDRRMRGEPIQYITGRQEFYGLSLRVTPAVLIPRPETELLVEAVLARLPNDRVLRIVDVGTGSGAIAIALACRLPSAEIAAIDLSIAALDIARENAAEHRVSERIRFLRSDLLGALADEDAFDAIVSNPPYVADGDRDSLHPQVREYEPASALFAGPQGLDIYRHLLPQAWAALRPDGLLALEIGYGQRDALEQLLSGWEGVEFLDDLRGIPRVALGSKAAR